ncbi:unnamed protein product [Anisakis simplex]|uniref:T-box domain-containing protein n=1 Tax=Anisakis simplex TaxID=6269 RepID=A0A0M3JYZ4_ANISI|nr:unnamed protein product [Anisakis simplex]
MSKRFSIDYLIGDTVFKQPLTNDDHQATLTETSSPQHQTGQQCAKSDASNENCKKRKHSDESPVDEYHEALQNVRLRLEGATLWNKFHSFGTEMIVTKTGRFVHFLKLRLFDVWN